MVIYIDIEQYEKSHCNMIFSHIAQPYSLFEMRFLTMAHLIWFLNR